MRLLSVIVSIAASFVSVAVWAENVPSFYFTEKPGPHGVGLKVVEQYDESRIYRHLTDERGHPYSGNRSRPLQALIWYPSEVRQGKAMTVGDYGELWATETHFGKPKKTSRAQEWLTAAKGALEHSMWAIRDARQVSAKFPVIIYAPGYSNPSWENADLCEYLASHGYVVLASPSMGARTREMTSDLEGVNAQARDISFLIAYVQGLPNADVSEIAVAGYSWGGLANLFAAARDNRIDALVALDGSMRYSANLVREAKIDPQEMSIPLLYFAQGELTLEDIDRYLSQNDGPNVLNTWKHGDLWTVRMHGLTHAQFSSMNQRNEKIWYDFAQLQKGDYGREYGIPAYGWIARYTLQFLNAYLKHDSQAMAYLMKKTSENGVPENFMSVRYRTATGPATSFGVFRSEVGQRGFAHAEAVYAAFRRQETNFELKEVDVNGWAEELIDHDLLAEAIALLELNVQIYPDSSNALANLGAAYEKSGLKSSAIESYRRTLEKVLEKNPIYAAAIRRKLERLEE
jgi:pimeloyl-ACP methyl ester carboxylesterase